MSLSRFLYSIGLAPVPLSRGTEDRLNALFHGTDRRTAAKLVSWFGSHLPPFPRDPVALERIRFAVLKLSRGKLSNLQSSIDEAHRDWREVLDEAGFSGDVNAHELWSPAFTPDGGK